MYFRYFVIITPWRRAWPFICKNLNPLHARMLCEVWLKLTQWVLRNQKCEKFTNGQTYTRRTTGDQNTKKPWRVKDWVSYKHNSLL